MKNSSPVCTQIIIIDVSRNIVPSQASVLFITVSPLGQGVLCTVTPIQVRGGGGGWRSWLMVNNQSWGGGHDASLVS